jgi:myo-inositol-1(or 4)-monophosphatase
MSHQFVAFIKSALTAAKPIALKHFASVKQIEVKSGDNNQVLTQADLEVGQGLVAAIQQAFPDHNVIDEEAGVFNKNSDFTWVIDPIDGTSNFANGLVTYGIMIGLLHQNQPIAGGLLLPWFDELYLGGVEDQATKNGQSISVSKQEKLLNSLVAYGIDGHQEDPERTRQEVVTLGEIVLAIRNLRTTNSAYDMAKMIEGRYGVFLNKTTKIWDNVAVQAIVEAAGGVCTDFYGKPIDYTNHLNRTAENFTICAGSPALHRQVQTIIAAHTQSNSELQ